MRRLNLADWLLLAAAIAVFSYAAARAENVNTVDAIASPGASFARPANTTAYAAGELVANSATAASVIPLTFTGAVRAFSTCYRIERITIKKTSAGLTNAAFKIFIFEAAPVPSVGDGGALDSSGALATSGVLGLKGVFSVTMGNSGSDGAVGSAAPTVGNGVTVCPAANATFYGLIEATAAYTPASGETFTVTAEGYRP